MDMISVFIQNRPGRLSQILREVSSLRLYGFSIADAGEFGIVRLCMDNPVEAVKKLKKHDLIAHVTPAIAIEDKDLSNTIMLFEEEKINIDDAIYAVIHGGKSLVVFKVADSQKAKEMLEKRDIKIY